MRDKIYASLRAQLSPGDKVIAAVSGGKDSMALLHAVHALRERLHISVSAAHFNHGLRGEEARRDEDFVRDYCASAGIPLSVGHGDVAAYANTHGLGTEDAARVLRYDFLRSLSPEARILTAHTAEDNLETVLMRLIRGSGLHGLAGIPPVRGNILRPMLGVTRQEIAAYLTEYQIPHVEDSTNGLDDCLRNRIRHHVLPLLEQENPALAVSVGQLCVTLRMEDDYLSMQANAALSRLSRDGHLDCAGLLTLPEALRYRVMALYLRPVPQLGRVHLDAALSLGRTAFGSAEAHLPGGWQLRRVYGTLTLTPPEEETAPPEPASPAPVNIAPGQSCFFGPWQVSCRLGPAPEQPEPGTLALDAAKAAMPLTLRVRRPGDTISLPGGTKKLSRLMMDEKIPARWRDSLPVLCSGDAILAVLPLKTAALCRPEAGRDSILLSATRMED